MSRTRVLAFASASVVVLGVAVALSGLGAQPAAVASPAHALHALPAIGLTLPADATFVGALDVQRLAATPFYKKQTSSRNAARLDAFRQLEQETGLNPERDVDQILLAGARTGRGVAIALGRFDPARLRQAVEARPGVTSAPVGGATLYTIAGHAPGQPSGLAVLDAGTIVTGELERVRGILEARGKGETPLRGNVLLFALTERVAPGSTFWMVGDGSLLSNLPTGGVGAPGGNAMALPSLKSLIVTGDVDPQIALSITGEATDEAAAKNLADTVRGLTSLFAFQAAQKPELQELATAFQVSQNAKEVLVKVRLSPATLEALQPKPSPVPPAQAAPKVQ